MATMRYSYLVVLLILVSSSVNWCLIVDGDYPTSRLDALEYMLVEEKQLRAKLELELNELKNSLNDTDKTPAEYVCPMSAHRNHAAFLATFRKSSDIRCSDQQTIVFDDVRLNIGSAYNPQNGMFTALVSGIYAFQVSLSSPPRTEYHVTIVKNVTSTKIGYLFNDQESMWRKRSTSAVAHMQAGEKVWMICLAKSQLIGHNAHAWDDAADYHSHFSGFLVNED